MERTLLILWIWCLFTLSLCAQSFSVQIDYDGPTCHNSSDAVLTAIPMHGTSPYVFAWNTGHTTATITDQSAGNYNVVVTDANGQQAMANVTIANPSPITWVLATNYATCEEAEDASAAVVSIQGGQSPYTYEWSTGDTGPQVSGLGADDYTLFITDANGCQVVDYFTIEVSPEGVWLMPSVTDALCYNEASGSIYAGVMTGTPPYTYAWSDPNFPNAATVTNVAAGTYQVTVTDANGCTGTEEGTVGEPPVLEAFVTATNIECESAELGTATVVASGGTPDYTYLWNTGDTTAFIDGLGVGDYTVEVFDSNLCLVTAQAPVSAPEPLIVSMSTKLETCPGALDGAVFVDNISGGTGPYTFEWMGLPDTTQLLDGVGAGIYTVLVTDAIGCIGEASAEVERSPEGLWVSTMITPVSCPDVADGALDATPMNGTPPYSYLWSPAFLGDTNYVSGLSPGTYFVTVTDLNGCQGQDTAVLLSPVNIEVSLDVTTPDCINGNAGAITANASGGNPPYMYLWSNGETTQTITGIPPGLYSVTVTDDNLCEVVESTQVDAVSNLVWSVSSQPVTCELACDGIASVDAVQGGTPPYTYEWNTGDVTASIDELCGGEYYVVIEDQSGCYGIAYVTVDTGTLEIEVAVTHPDCAGEDDGTITVTPLNGEAPYLYRWDDPNLPEDNMLTGLSEGNYSVTVTDANGCEASETVNVVEPDSLTLILNKVDDDCKNGFNGSVTATVTGGTPDYIYSWSTFENTQSITELAPGLYCVTVTDLNGCAVEGCITIEGENPNAGTLSAVVDDVCLEGSSATFSAVTDGNAVIPPDYNLLYLLSTGANQTIIQANFDSIFTVSAGGAYTIHTFVYNSATFDINMIVIGSTTIDDLVNMIEPIGDICADVDVVGATILVIDPDAGALEADATEVCLENGSATLSATHTINPNVPANYQLLYLLTSEPNLVILQANTSPSFSVSSGGDYRIHTFVYNPSTFDINSINLGVTTAQDVLDQISPIGDICADLDASGAPVSVNNPDAGTLTAQAPEVCLGFVTEVISAIPNGDAQVPAGYQTVYLLTQQAGLVILETNNVPEFIISAGGQYRIHTFVYNPSTFNINSIVLGTTNVQDILNQIAPVGDICADLDAQGVSINVEDPEAGTVSADAGPVCLVNGMAPVVATFDNNGNIPNGYQRTYLLSSASSQIILQQSNSPSFTVGSEGTYTVHAFVYDPTTFNINSIVLGTSTINNVRQEIAPIGDICADLDLDGADIVVEVCEQCVNIGDYVWYDNNRNGIQDSYEPGVANFLVRLMTAGADNVFGTPDDVVRSYVHTNQNGYYLFDCVPPGTYRIVFVPTELDIDEVFTNPNAGSNDELDSDANPNDGSTVPFVITPNQMDDDLSWDAGIYDLCVDVTYGGEICCNQTICAGETPALITEIVPISGGLPGVEYVWMYTTSPLNQSSVDWYAIPNSNTVDYQPGPLFTTTSFVRCVRNPGCSVFTKESNAVTITVLPIGTPSCLPSGNSVVLEVKSVSEHTAQITWQSQDEADGIQYVLEHAGGEREFSELMAVPGKGIGNHLYDYMHADARPSMNYYRVRVEMQGNFLYYSDEVVLMMGATSKDIMLFPNPFSEELIISSVGKMVYDGEVTIFNAAGQIVNGFTFEKGELMNKTLNMRYAPQGVYFVRMIYNNAAQDVEVYRIMKL